jgi:hypothetical protein
MSNLIFSPKNTDTILSQKIAKETVIYIPIDQDTFVQKIANEFFKVFQADQNTIQDKPEDDLITPKEACEILKCSLVSLWRYEKKGRVKPYGIVGKKYFKRSEILQSIVKK